MAARRPKAEVGGGLNHNPDQSGTAGWPTHLRSGPCLIVFRLCSRPAPACLWLPLCLLGVVTYCPPGSASDLLALAEIHAASGYEGEVVEYVQSQLGRGGEVDNTGSLTVRFGKGSPHTLLVAGLDEPGFVVSGINDQGYLRLERLADPSPHYDFDTFFLGQPVRVTKRTGQPVWGVVAAPSVHFDSGRSYSSRSGPDDLFVDIGARSKAEVLAAGVDVLDSLTLERTPFRLADGHRATAPWISSRAGAAVLIALGRAMAESPPEGAVTLAFVTQQFFHNRGLLRVLDNIEADRVIYIKPAGGIHPGIAAVLGVSSDVQDAVLEAARSLDLSLERSTGERLEWGPFGAEDPWPRPEQSAVLTVGVENPGTPVEVVDTKHLDRIAALLAKFCGVKLGELRQSALPDSASPDSSGAALDGTKDILGKDHSPQPGSSISPLASLIRLLTHTAGVSGFEGPVRNRIRERLPGWARERSTVDENGNLIVRLGRENPPETIFIAHMDEIGFTVSRIHSDGEISLDTVGGGSANLFAWHPVVLHGANGPLRAIMTRHGTVNMGAESADQAAAMGIGKGTAVTVPKKFRRLLGHRATVRSFDDRIGCAVLLAVLQSLNAADKPVRAGRPTWIVFSVQEETGMVGAQAVAGATAAKRVFAIDSFVTSDSPLEDKRIANAALGNGFVVRAKDNSGIAPREAVEQVLTLAKKLKILAQRGVTAGSNDGSKFVRRGAVNIPLSWPLRYAHSAAEVADLRDVEALHQIVGALVEAGLAEESP